MTENAINNGKKTNFALVAAIYLAGIFMGAIDTGILSPARTVIQNNLMVDEKSGIWMITIYTLAFAASIPIMGKLADKFGRKYIYLISIFLFGLGSLFCGLAQPFGSFPLLLAARAVQALGGGGIIPIATAEFGTTFPPEKRGMALGLVGGVYGIANIFGASAGSAILDIFGKNNWQFIFYVNIPITLFILVAGFVTLKNNRVENVKKIDFIGIFILVVMVLSLMYGLKNIDFFDFGQSIRGTDVYPFLLIFLILLPIFVLLEKKAEDPVLNLSFFTNRSIVVTLGLAFITGIILIGLVFIPQFAENALKVSSGSGGYFVIILGLFAGIGAPVSGKLIDKYGPKIVLGLGFLVSAIGGLFLVLVAADHPNTISVITSLILIGTGLGFTIGTPLNYMMLEQTKKEESNSALATLSLIRSIGTAIAPAIMVAFIAQAGSNVQGNVMALLPKNIEIPPLPYAAELNDQLNKYKSDPNLKDRFKDVSIPDLNSFGNVEINMSGGGGAGLPQDLIEQLRTSDVTNIVDRTKLLSERMFETTTPDVVKKIQSGIQTGIDGINAGIAEIDKNIAGLETGYNGIVSAMAAMPPQAAEAQKAQADGMAKAIEGAKTGRNQLKDIQDKMTALKNAVPGAFVTGKNNYLAKIEEKREAMESEFQRTLNVGFKQIYLTVAISSLLAIAFLTLYRRKSAIQPQ